MTVGHLPGVLGPLTTAARAVWFVAWSALAGATAWSWIFGPSRPLPPAQAAATQKLWRRGLELGWPWVAQATLLLFVAAIFGAATTNTSASEVAQAGASWLGLAVVLALLRAPIRRLSESPASGDAAFERDRVGVSWLVALLAAGEVATTRTPTKAPELLRIAIDGTHLASAGFWLGTLALFVVLLRSAEWQAAATPGASVRPVVRPVVEASARAAGLLIGSGLLAAAISSPGLGHWAGEYSWLLGAKAAVLVVAAAIAWRQWVIVHSRQPLHRPLGPMMLEAGALVAALALAAILVGVDPIPSAGAAAAPGTATSETTTTTPACLHGTPGTECDGATIAGVVGGLDAGAIDATLPELCSTDPSRPKAYGYFTCLTQVGQAVASRDNGDLATSLTHCTVFTDVWAQQQCGTGAIYDVLQHSAPPASDPGADPTWPCTSVGATFKAPCYLGVSTRLLAVEHDDAGAAFAVCDGVGSEWQADCYQGMGRAFAVKSGFMPVPIVGQCAQAGALGPSPCIVGAVRTLVYQNLPDAAAALCADADPAARTACDDQRAAATAEL